MKAAASESRTILAGPSFGVSFSTHLLTFLEPRCDVGLEGGWLESEDAIGGSRLNRRDAFPGQRIPPLDRPETVIHARERYLCAGDRRRIGLHRPVRPITRAIKQPDERFIMRGYPEGQDRAFDALEVRRAHARLADARPREKSAQRRPVGIYVSGVDMFPPPGHGCAGGPGEGAAPDRLMECPEMRVGVRLPSLPVSSILADEEGLTILLVEAGGLLGLHPRGVFFVVGMELGEVHLREGEQVGPLAAAGEAG